MKNLLLIFLRITSRSKNSGIIYLLVLTIPALLISCSKEYSCENNCRLSPPVIKDTSHIDTSPPVTYIYYSSSYHVSLAGTGNNAWGYTIPSFDTASGILDTVEIKMSTTLDYYFALLNKAGSDNLYSIGITRKDSLSYDSILLINHDYTFSYGPQKIPGLSTFRDSLSVLNNIELTSVITTQLDKFAGNKYIAFNYTPYSSAHVVGTNYSLDNSFHDSTFIESTYYYKKKSD